MKKGVMRPGHIQIRVLDMDEAVKHYRDLIGLIEVDRDSEGRVYLKGWTEIDKFSVVLREADEPGMDFVAYKVRFDSPTGHMFELFSEKEQTGKWGLSNVNPEAWPRGLKGMRATRFDHCLLYGPNIEGSLKLFREVLGFDLAEQVLDENDTRLAQFLTVSMKAHDVAFIEHPEPGKLHHASFFLNTWEDVLRAADLISMEDVSLDIGPTRHGLTHGKTIYFFDPSGNRSEVFCEGDYHYPDHPPVTWKAENLGKAIFYHDRVLNDRFLTVLT